MSRMILDFDDDDLSDCSCSIGDDDDDLMWDTDSTSTDSFYKVNHLLGQELFTIWELEDYNSDDDDYTAPSMEGDDDIASITSVDLQQEEKKEDDNKMVVSNMPSCSSHSLKKSSHHSKFSKAEASDIDDDLSSIDSTGAYEERWHVDENGLAKKSPFADASWERDMKRREIQRKMRNLEERISAIRGIVSPDLSKEERSSRSGRRKSPRRGRGGRSPRGRRGGRSPARGRAGGRRRHRSLSPKGIPDRSKSPPRNSTFNDTLENRRKQVALARQELQDRLARGRSNKQPLADNSSSSSSSKSRQLTNPRHLHRQAMKRMNPNSIPSRLRTI